jgi:hypothetical protein
MRLKRTALGGLFLALFCFTAISLFVIPTADAAKKKSQAAKKAAPGAGPSEKEKKLLAFTTSYPSSYAIGRPDFFIRGTVVNFNKVPGTKEYKINLLPLEVMKNPNHYIKLDHYKKGIEVRLHLSEGELKTLRPGAVVEYNQYSKEVPTQTMGHAKLISTEDHTEFKPFNVAPVAYLTKSGMEPEQLINALTGSLLYGGPIDKTDKLKTALAGLSSNKNPTIAKKAKELNTKVFGQ